MRLLLDEMLAATIAEQLRERGHDARAINRDPLAEGASDPEVLALACDERRALVTHNLVDFRPLHHAAIAPGGEGHFGMVFLPGSYRRTKADVGRIIAALEAVLAECPSERDLANGETWL